MRNSGGNNIDRHGQKRNALTKASLRCVLHLVSSIRVALGCHSALPDKRLPMHDRSHHTFGSNRPTMKAVNYHVITAARTVYDAYPARHEYISGCR